MEKPQNKQNNDCTTWNLDKIKYSKKFQNVKNIHFLTYQKVAFY